MKQLNPDGSITIPSNRPRTRQGPDSRGPRLCFQELGRSCALKQGFLIFMDGSAYAYDVPSNEPVEALVEQIHRGAVFNYFVRRSRGGYIRGFTPPADYETIYSFPPYEGFAPTSCPLDFINFNDIVWDPANINFGTPPRSVTASLVGALWRIDIDGLPFDPHTTVFPLAEIQGGFDYTGPGGVCNLDLVSSGTFSDIAFFLEAFTQDGLDVDISMPGPAPTGVYTFDINAGIASPIFFKGLIQGITGAPPAFVSGEFNPNH